MIWLTPAEIAKSAREGLFCDLPTNRRNIQRMIDREDWVARGFARPRGGREGGGGLEYNIALALPASVRTRYLLAQIDFDAAFETEGWHGQGTALSAQDNRLMVLNMLRRFQRECGLTKSCADIVFCDLYNSGDMNAPEWLRAEITTISPRTLARWRKAATGECALQKRGRPKGSGVLAAGEDGKVKNLILGKMGENSHLRARHIRAIVLSEYPNGIDVIDEETGECQSFPVPSERMFQIFMKELRETHSSVLLKMQNPDKFRSTKEFTVRGTQRAERLNEIWQIDASPADVLLLDENGKAVRYSIYTAEDIYSRQTTIYVSRTPRAAAVAQLLRKCLLKWGVPEKIKTDNGSDFVARSIKRLLNSLEITVELSPPYRPETKGSVERVIGTFQSDLAVVPGYIGHSVADRKAIESRHTFAERLGSTDHELFCVELRVDEFITHCDHWAEVDYASRKHSTLGMEPKVKAAQYKGAIKTIENEAALDVLLAPIASNGGLRTMTKSGIRVNGEQYALTRGYVEPGAQVLVRQDEHDLGRVMLFDPETDQFLAEATSWQLSGQNPGEIQAKTKALQKRHIEAIYKDARKEARKIKPRDVMDAIAREADARAGKIAALPQRTEAYEVQALNEASLASKERPLPQSVTPIDAARKNALEATPKRQAAKNSFEEANKRYQRALGLERDMAAGREVSVPDQAWLSAYQEDPEYCARRITYGEMT